MCENSAESMAASPKDLAARKILFVVLLIVIAGAIAYAVVQNRPWTVPEEAKRRKNPLQPSEAALRAIRPIYNDKCAVCHGQSGRGDGHDASLYDPRPTNFTDSQYLDLASDGELFYKMTEGHRPMPSFKRRLSEEQRWQLVLLIRSFATSARSSDNSVTLK
jgi:mono/diheme cytochrome c family protein